MKRKKPTALVTQGSDNVFADLKFHNADELNVKTYLALHLKSIIKQCKFDLDEAAQRLGLDRTELEKIMNAKLDSFSKNQLEQFIDKLY